MSCFVEAAASGGTGVVGVQQQVALALGVEGESASLGALVAALGTRQPPLPEKDADAIVVSLLHLMSSSGSASLVEPLMQAIDTLRNSLSPDALFALAVNVYNAPDLAQGQTRVEVFTQAAKYAQQGGSANLRLLCRQLPEVLSTSLGWGLSTGGRRQLLSACADVAAAAQEFTDELSYLLEAIKLVDSPADASSPAVRALTVRWICQAIRLSTFLEYDRIKRVEALAALSGTPDSWAEDLLQLFFNADLKGLPAFVAKTSGALEANGLTEEILSSELRVFCLCNLCSRKGVLGYAEVADLLDVSEEEVERWVVKTVRSGSIQVKMNQPQKQIVVKSALPFNFAEDQWSKLSLRLRDWRKRLEGLSTSVSASLTSTPAAPSAALAASSSS